MNFRLALRPRGGLRPDTNGLPLVPAEGLGLWPSAACKVVDGATGVGHFAPSFLNRSRNTG